MDSNSKPRFYFMLWPSRGSLDHFWYHWAFLGAHVTESLSYWAAEAEILWRTLACSSPCLECAGLLCMKGLTWLCVCTLSFFVHYVVDFPYIFLCVTSGGTTWTLTVLNHIFHMFLWRKSLQDSLCFPHVIVTEAVLSISFISDAVFLSVKENLIQVSCFFKSAIIKGKGVL